jgi:hypothetical protein
MYYIFMYVLCMYLCITMYVFMYLLCTYLCMYSVCIYVCTIYVLCMYLCITMYVLMYLLCTYLCMYYVCIYVCTMYVFMYVLCMYYVCIYVCTMHVRMSEYQERSCDNSTITNSSLLPHITVTVNHYCDSILALSLLSITRINETKLSGPRLEIILERT